MARLPTELEITSRLRIPRRELSVRTARSGGPGGQHVNKTSSKVELRWHLATSESLTESDRAWLLKKLAARLTDAGELIIQSDNNREQSRNLSDALERLTALLRESLVRPRKRRKTRPTRGSTERRLKQKKKHGETKRNRRPPSTE